MVWTNGYILNLSDCQHSVQDSSENNVFSVQKIALLTRNKELTSVSVWTAVCHGEQSRASVLYLKVLIFKL